VEEATEEELAFNPQKLMLDDDGNGVMKVRTSVAISKYEFKKGLSEAEFNNGEFPENAIWKKTTAAVMGEKIVPLGVAHSELIPMLVKAVQELSKKVDELSK
jgi:hypothetical protein